MKLSEKILTGRKKKGLSQVDLADALGVSRQSVSKWETDESKPEINKLPALARVLDVSIDWLLSEEDMEDQKEDSPFENDSVNREAVVKGYPNWADKVPGFLGKAIKKYGWIYGVKFMIAGAIIVLFGIVVRVMSYQFIFDGDPAAKTYDSVNIYDAMDIYYDTMPDVIGFQAYEGSAFSEINNRAWTAFSVISGLIIGIGILMLVGGIILTVLLKQWANKK